MSAKREILYDSFQLNTELKELMGNSRIGSKAGFKGILYERFRDDYGNIILNPVGSNTVVIGGAVLSLEMLTGLHATWVPKSLNELYNIGTDKPGDDLRSRIALFGVGTGGSGLAFDSIVEKDVKRRDLPELIPLRSSAELTGDDADRYFFKKDNGDGTFNWYLKEFSVEPVIKSFWKDALDDESDGTEIVDEIADSTREEGQRSFASFILDFNTKDVREYFESIGSLNMARYNSIGLFTGEKIQQNDGTYEYANVHLFSYLNIDNKSVKIKTASEYEYRILSLV